MKRTRVNTMTGLTTRNTQAIGAAAALLVFALIAVTACTAGCTESGSESPTSPATEVGYTGTGVEKVEIFHFHGATQCDSCITLGRYAEDTVNTYYMDEQESGRLVFRHIDMTLPENKEVVDRYGPTASSLWIGIYDSRGFYSQQLLTPWYLLGSKAEYVTYLREVIDQQLG